MSAVVSYSICIQGLIFVLSSIQLYLYGLIFVSIGLFNCPVAVIFVCRRLYLSAGDYTCLQGSTVLTSRVFETTNVILEWASQE